MARQTTILTTTDDPTTGTAYISSGQSLGTINRSVVITAVPAPGYEFDRWEYIKTPVPITDIVNVGGRTTDIATMCNTATNQTEATSVLYIENNVLYNDPYGNSLAAAGYWGAGGNAYYTVVNGKITATSTCPKDDTGGQSGSTGSSSGQSNKNGASCITDADCENSADNKTYICSNELICVQSTDGGQQ